MAGRPQSVLITGCSPGGIGHALAKEFHAKGFRVFATARNTEVLKDLEDLGLETFGLDVTSQSSIDGAKDEVARRTRGGLDWLVNNAGRSYTVPALDVDFDEVYKTFDTNLFGVMRMCQTFAPLIIKAKGTIVQIGSVAAVMPYVFGSTYNASKAALHAYSDSLRIELAPFGVKVITIITGGVISRIARVDRQLPPDSLYHPVKEAYDRRRVQSQTQTMPTEEYAQRLVKELLANASASFIVPTTGVGPDPSIPLVILSSMVTSFKSSVASLLGRAVPKRYIWAGAEVWPIWLVNKCLPEGSWDIIFSKMYNFHQLSEHQAAQGPPPGQAGTRSSATAKKEL